MFLKVHLWWLVRLHFHFSLNFFLLLKMLFFFLKLLLSSELFKHILIVKNGMSKLILEGVTFQELLDSGLNLRHFEYLVYRWSIIRLSL